MSLCSSSIIHIVHTSKTHKLILSKLDDQSSQHGNIAHPTTITSSQKIVNNIRGVFPLLFSSIPSITSNMASFLNSLNPTIVNPQYPPFVDPHIVLQGNFSPVDETPPSECFVVEGEIPPSLNGVYLRNGPNPQHHPRRPYHLFEGDGMLHSIKLFEGRAIYCNRYVKTYKYKLEHDVGSPIIANVMSGFYGLLDLSRFINYVGKIIRGQIRLDEGTGSANTSVVSFYNRIFAMMEADLPYEIELTKNGDIVTKGRFDFDGNAPYNMTAHPKIDAESGAVYSFQCFPIFPYLTLFCFEADGSSKKKQVSISCLKHPIYVHDFAITKQYVIFQDTQVEMDTYNLFLCKGMPITCKPTKIPRVGVISRNATNDSKIKWYKVPGFNAFHILNAWEDDDDAITIVAPNLLTPEQFFGKLNESSFSLEKLRIELKTDLISRTILSRKSLEMGSINPAYQGKKNRFVYMGISGGVPKMSGVVKIDLELGHEVASRSYGPNLFGGETLFVPRRGDNDLECCDEDDGYIFSYIHDEKNNESMFVIMDAKSPMLDILVAIRLPGRAPYGFHGLFVRD